MNKQKFTTIDLLDSSNMNSLMRQTIHAIIPRPSSSQLEVVQDEKFTPIEGLNQSLYVDFQRHQRLENNLTAKQQSQKRQIKKNQSQSPTQITTNIYNVIMNNTQNNFESIKFKLKDNHQQKPTKFQNSYNTNRPTIPSSFYSVRRYVMQKLKN